MQSGAKCIFLNMKRRVEILTIQNLHVKIFISAYRDKRVWQICIREEANVKKRAFLALILVLTLCASVGHAALVQVGGAQQQKGLALTTATPEPTQAPNVVKGLGQSSNQTKSTVMGSDQANAGVAPVEATAEPAVEATAEPVVEATAEPVVEATAEPVAEPVADFDLSEGTVYTVKGFAEFSVIIKLDEEGRIVFVAVPEHSETPAYGAAVLDNAAIFEALQGQFIGDAQVDAVGGATQTVNALNDALAQAAAAYGVEPAEPETQEQEPAEPEVPKEQEQEPAAQESEGSTPGKRL